MTGASLSGGGHDGDQAPLDDEAIANFRNRGLMSGLSRAIASAQASGELTQGADGVVRVLHIWRALSRLSGIDAHGHHGIEAEEGDVAQPGVVSVRNVTKDCTHASPDALLFELQVLVKAITAPVHERREHAG